MSVAALLLWLLLGSCLNPRPDDLPAGAENDADSDGTPVNDSARSTGPSAAPTPNTPAASGTAAPADDGVELFDAVAPAPQDAGVPADAEPPADPSLDAGADAN